MASVNTCILKMSMITSNNDSEALAIASITDSVAEEIIRKWYVVRMTTHHFESNNFLPELPNTLYALVPYSSGYNPVSYIYVSDSTSELNALSASLPDGGSG